MRRGTAGRETTKPQLPLIFFHGGGNKLPSSSLARPLLLCSGDASLLPLTFFRSSFSPNPQQVFKPPGFSCKLTSPVSSLVRKWKDRKSLGFGGEGLGSRPHSPLSRYVTLGKWPNLSESFCRWKMRKPSLPLWSL